MTSTLLFIVLHCSARLLSHPLRLSPPSAYLITLPNNRMSDTCDGSLSINVGSGLQYRQLLSLGSFNVRILKQVGQQAHLTLTTDSLAVVICCVRIISVYFS